MTHFWSGLISESVSERTVCYVMDFDTRVCVTVYVKKLVLFAFLAFSILVILLSYAYFYFLQIFMPGNVFFNFLHMSYISSGKNRIRFPIYAFPILEDQ